MDKQSEKEFREQVVLVVLVAIVWIFSESIVDFLCRL